MNLEASLRVQLATEIYRLSVNLDWPATLVAMGLDDSRLQEAIEFLDARRDGFDSDAFLDRFFSKIYPTSQRQTRFSDGSIPVYYSALEPETAQAEVKHWILKDVDQYPVDRLYYRLFQCMFSGEVVDTLERVVDFPWLIANDGYDQCNQIARDAIRLRLDGLLTRSARRQEGRCLPIFRRTALSNAQPQEHFCFSIDRAAMSVQIVPVG